MLVIDCGLPLATETEGVVSDVGAGLPRERAAGCQPTHTVLLPDASVVGGLAFAHPESDAGLSEARDLPFDERKDELL
jgi:hypothetical protein